MSVRGVGMARREGLIGCAQKGVVHGSASGPIHSGDRGLDGCYVFRHIRQMDTMASGAIYINFLLEQSIHPYVSKTSVFLYFHSSIALN